jgi:hypothetical protein
VVHLICELSENLAYCTSHVELARNEERRFTMTAIYTIIGIVTDVTPYFFDTPV